MPTMTGSCHCGAVAFEVDVDGGLRDLRRCNCSLCRRRGAIMGSVALDALRVVRGQDMLTLYQWNTKLAKHWFCRVCGIYTHHQRRRDPTQFGFNVACLHGIDPLALGPIAIGDGASHSVVGAPPATPPRT